MTTSVFPASLPGPSVSQTTPAERRLLSDVTGGPQQARGIQRDYLARQQVQWTNLNATEAADLDAWFTNSLISGGAWFTAVWPAPQGWVSIVRRFIGAPRWTHQAGQFWNVDAEVLVRGRGLDPTTKRYQVIFPTGVSGVFASQALALSAAQAKGTILGTYPTAYAAGTTYVSFKTSANSVLNCFSGGATLGVAHTYVDFYYASLGPLPSNISSNSASSGSNFCAYLSGAGAVVSGAVYLDREGDPVITANNVDTTAWGPFKLVPGSASSPTTADFPLFLNNCTNYAPAGAYFPQAISSPFTIIRGLDD